MQRRTPEAEGRAPARVREALLPGWPQDARRSGSRALAVFALAAALVASPALARGPRIVIDPGHGGSQEGALGPGGLLEKQLSLEISRRLKAALERELRAEVVLTRDRDVPLSLSERVAIANRHPPELLVSIHANSMPTRKLRAQTQGIETYFLSASASDDDARHLADRENSESGRSTDLRGDDTLGFILADLQRTEAHVESSRLAYAIHQGLIAASGAEDRGVRQAPFFVLMGVDAPSVLVEVGFISHPSEGKKLKSPDYQQKIADAIAAGVAKFLEAQSRSSAPIARPSGP